MADFDFDFFVIGGGSGGVRAARIAAGHGARVGIAEERYLGGTCVNVGCVPKKLLVYAAHFSRDFVDAAGFGWTVGDREHDWGRLITNKNTEIERLNAVYRRLLDTSGAEVFDARARLIDRHELEVGGRRIRAERILIATGGWPVVPDEPGAREHGITSNEVFFLEEMPRRVVIVGGGYIAVEFAGIFNGLGADVVQLYRGPLFLRGFDDDIRTTLAEEMAKAGVNLRFQTRIAGIERTGAGLAVRLADGSEVETDCVLYATGRRPNSVGMGLEEVGVSCDRHGAVIVDEDYRTTVPNIYALGDVTNRINLTPVATAEGHALADTLFGSRPRRVSYENVATAVFSTPPAATVGCTEAEARMRGMEVDIYKSSFRAMKQTLSGRDEKTMMKLVVERRTQKVVGCHMVGDDSGEIMQGLAIAVNCGATKADFDRTIGIHPTAAEEFVTLRTKEPDPVAEVAAQ